jgi:hypothetical protein
MRTYRINKDKWLELEDILISPPEDFNPDLKKTWTIRSNGWEGWKYTGALRGRTITRPSEILMGQLPEEYQNYMVDKVVRYVIYSYETPIAWMQVAEWDSDGAPIYEWVIPNVKYTVTTSKHQGKVRTALYRKNYGE